MTMPAANEYDIAIIGSGPGGYVAAIRAAQLGARVAIVEKEAIGGTCLNWGCIPSKALLESAALVTSAKGAAAMGVDIAGVTADFPRVHAFKDKVVRQMTSGVEGLLKSNKVTVYSGVGSFVTPRRIRVQKADGTSEEITAKSVVIATGSVEARPPIPGIDSPGVMTSREALSLTALPESIVIVGGGYIGVEFATVYSSFGSKVTVVEMLPTIVPLEDPEIGKALATAFIRQGIAVKTGTRVTKLEPKGAGFAVSLAAGDATETVEAATVLVAVGRTPYTEGLGLDRIGVARDRRAIKVDRKMRTSVPGVYAIGDSIAGIMLAHVASAEGEVAVENALGHEAEMDYRAVPNTVFCQPQVASVGMTEEAARAAGYDVRVGRFPFLAVAKAVAANHQEGFVKVVAESQYNQVLGVQMIGHHVADLIGEATMAIKLETTLEDFAQTIHAHPTLTEALKEAALDADGRPIHIFRRKR
jgi:dihydrolipoamide dehydrogenase